MNNMDFISADTIYDNYLLITADNSNCNNFFLSCFLSFFLSF